MNKYVIIVAGGKGLRMGRDLPKQFIQIGRYPVLMTTINRFILYDKHIKIIVGLPLNHHEYWQKLCEQFNFSIYHQVVSGGETRFHTVQNCLGHMNYDGLIAIHDGVRPFVSQQTIEKCFSTAHKEGTAIPYLPLSESIRFYKENESTALNRDNYCTIQTPEVFRSDIIINAYKTEYSPTFTDDASVAEKAGYKINLVEGNIENIKITTPADLRIAKCFIDDFET